MKKARECFKRALELVQTRNYDYGIELYMQGLTLWPEAVAEGLRGLWVTGVARRQAGGKPAGFFELRKFTVNTKDLRANLLHALRLFALEPVSSQNMEAILVNAARLCLTRTGQWIAPILWEAFSKEKKISLARCETIYQALDQIGDQLTALDDFSGAQEIFRVAQNVADLWKQHAETSQDAARAVSAASSKLTIVKGRFGTSEGFTQSLKDGGEQRDLHDRQRSAQEQGRVRELIAKARDAYQADAETPGKLFALVELLTRSEIEPDENEAIQLLDAAFARSTSYGFKFKADEIRMRQLTRAVRDAVARFRAQPQNAALRDAAEALRRRQLETEEAILRERIRHYPTDMRLLFELGVRLFHLRRIDDAIPAFQQAQREPKNRDATRLFIGRCFFEKQFHAQALETLETAIREHELPDDEVGKALRYWLARTHEAMHHVGEATRAYGQLIQFDYNYADARMRFEKLSTPSG